MAGERVRWGVLATGGIAASFTADLLDMPDAEVVAVASRTEAGAKAFAERFGIGRAYGDWASLAADEDIDVVYVATPHAAHRRAAGLCLGAGRPVLVEKAFTLNAPEAVELVALARARGLFLMEAMWMYCNPLIRRLKGLVDDGAIGTVRAVHADFGIDGSFPATHRLRDPAQGGGALLDLGVYPVSFAQLFLGEAGRGERGGHAVAGGGRPPDRHGAVVRQRRARGAALRGQRAHPGRRVGHRQRGAGGDPRRVLLPGAVRAAPGRQGAAEFVTDPADGPRDTFRHEAAEVMRCLRAGAVESPLVPLDGSLAVMRTLDAVRERTGVRYPGERV